MKKTKCMPVVALSLGMLLASCSQNLDVEGQQASGQGKLNVTLKPVGTELFVGTRAVQEQSYANTDEYTVVVVDKDGNDLITCKGSELFAQMPLTMPIGSFKVKAFYGTESAASRDFFYVYGDAQGIIKAEAEIPVAVTCTPTCGRISVNFDAEMAKFYSDYNVTFGGTKALGAKTISWQMADTEPWYVKLDSQGETISFDIAVTTKDEYINGDNKEKTTTKSGTFSLARNKAYRMNIKPVYTETGSGELNFTVTIDESTIDKEYDIEVPVDWIQ